LCNPIQDYEGNLFADGDMIQIPSMGYPEGLVNTSE